MRDTCVKRIDCLQKFFLRKSLPVFDSSSQNASLQRKADMANGVVQREKSPRPNNTGLPDNLKSGIESLSGFSMEDVRVHYNSSKPATVQALAYTLGTDIHVAPGQEKCLPHEAWHVAQQMAGRVSPTTNINGIPVNDNAALEHEADVMGAKTVQRMADDVCCGNNNSLEEKRGNNISLQRTVVDAELNDYENAYGAEIARTGTWAALNRMRENFLFGARKNIWYPFKFTDDFIECGVRTRPTGINTNGQYINEVLFIVIPDPRKDPYNVNNMKYPNVKNLFHRLNAEDVRRVFAIHELEHLRVMWKNTGGILKADNTDFGEPFPQGNLKDFSIPLKRELVDKLRNKIPKNLDKKLKAYIEMRLSYMFNPDKSWTYESETAREVTSVLLELIKFCECVHGSGLKEFKNELNLYYEKWKR